MCEIIEEINNNNNECYKNPRILKKFFINGIEDEDYFFYTSNIEYSNLFFGKFDAQKEEEMSDIIKKQLFYAEKINAADKKNKVSYDREINPEINTTFMDVYNKLTQNLCIIKPQHYKNLKPIIKQFLANVRTIILSDIIPDYPKITNYKCKQMWENNKALKYAFDNEQIIMTQMEDNLTMPFINTDEDRTLRDRSMHLEYHYHGLKKYNAQQYIDTHYENKKKAGVRINTAQYHIFEGQFNTMMSPIFHTYLLFKKKQMDITIKRMSEIKKITWNTYRKSYLKLWAYSMQIFDEITAGIRKYFPYHLYITLYDSAYLNAELVDKNAIVWV